MGLFHVLCCVYFPYLVIIFESNSFDSFDFGLNDDRLDFLLTAYIKQLQYKGTLPFGPSARCSNTLQLGWRLIRLYINGMATVSPGAGAVKHNLHNFLAKAATKYAGK